MPMTDDELEACRVFLAAYRRIERNGRIEAVVRDKGPRSAPDVRVRIVHLEAVTASATIPVQAEAR